MEYPYKFQFEYEVGIDGTRKECSRIRFVTYGHTADEALKAHEEFYDKWHKFLKKPRKDQLTNRNDSKPVIICHVSV